MKSVSSRPHQGPLKTRAIAASGKSKEYSVIPPLYIDVGACQSYQQQGVAYATSFLDHRSQADLHVGRGGSHD